MKPGISAYDEFKRLFDLYSKKAGKKQYLIPYFIAAHPGCDEEDMLNLSLWLKNHNFKPDQVQTFYPSPMALATAMYYSERNPLQKLRYKGDKLSVSKDIEQRRLQKAYLRYHDEKNWPLLRESLKRLGREELIGTGKTVSFRRLRNPEQRHRPAVAASGRHQRNKLPATLPMLSHSFGPLGLWPVS